MTASLFSGKTKAEAEALAEMIYANPFTDERRRLERRVLGDDYVEPAKYLMPGQPLHRLEGNLRGLIDRAGAILNGCQPRMERMRSIPEGDRSIYEALVHFMVFHNHAAAFDGLIEAAPRLTGSTAHESKPPRVSVPALFDRCCRDLERYAGHEEIRADLLRRAADWFGFYFQVRRAWVHIYAFIHGGSDAIRQLRARIWQSVFTHDMRRYQRSLFSRMGDITTLISGPSGTGKELVARAIGLSRFIAFNQRERSFAASFSASFHPLNLSALSATLIESELFGHRRGAFTGALGDREGYFETCGEHGTVFLDEIGETAPEIQVKLLRVLQTRQFNRLGDTKARLFEGRIVAATNRDLPMEIAAGRFREDFFFRLCADRIETPGLREVLAGDVRELECFVAHICAAQAGEAEAAALADEVLGWMRKNLGKEYAWPGNFRELEQCVRNLIVHGHYDPPIGPTGAVGGADWTSRARASLLTMDQLLHHYCTQVVQSSGTLEAAARQLGADRRTVRRYLRMTSETEGQNNP